MPEKEPEIQIPTDGSVLDMVKAIAKANGVSEKDMAKAEPIMQMTEENRQLRRRLLAYETKILTMEADLLIASKKIFLAENELGHTKMELKETKAGLRDWEKAALEAKGGDYSEIEELMTDVLASQEVPDGK